MKCGKGGLAVAGDTRNGKKSVNHGIGSFVVGALHASRKWPNGLLSRSLICVSFLPPSLHLFKITTGPSTN